jgi:hypothetical protein
MLGPAKPRRLDQPIAVSLEDLVPADNFYRHLEARLDLSFVRDWVRERYAERGRPSIDPAIFFTRQLIMFFGRGQALAWLASLPAAWPGERQHRGVARSRWPEPQALAGGNRVGSSPCPVWKPRGPPTGVGAARHRLPLRSSHSGPASGDRSNPSSRAPAPSPEAFFNTLRKSAKRAGSDKGVAGTGGLRCGAQPRHGVCTL